MKTTGNTILITGGATGIGLALAEEFLRRDNQVIICGRRQVRLAAAKRHLPHIRTRVCDISNPASRRALVKWITSEFKDLNMLVNNAGIQRQVDFCKAGRDLAQADDEVAINLVAPIHLSALLIPHLRRHTPAAIVNISSGLAFTPLAQVPVYCATKAAIHSLSLTMRFQLRDTSVRVFEVAPPIVPTALSGRRARPDEEGISMSVSDVARGVVDTLEHDTFEVALGPAQGLRKNREALFDRINE